MYLLAIRTPIFDEWELVLTSQGTGPRVFTTWDSVRELPEIYDQHEYIVIEVCKSTYWTYTKGYVGWVEHEGSY